MTGWHHEADRIHIRELELMAHIGVPEEERSTLQRLTVTMTLWPVAGFDTMHDRLDETVNYAAVCLEVKELVGRRADKLIETLADAIARHLLATFSLRRVAVELRKFILPETKFVAVSIVRDRAQS